MISGVEFGDNPSAYVKTRGPVTQGRVDDFPNKETLSFSPPLRTKTWNPGSLLGPLQHASVSSL